MGALAAAGVGLTHVGGSDAALKFADIILDNRRLNPIPAILDLGAAVRQSARLNLLVSLTYNGFAIGLALMGLIGPLIAAVLMPLSSLSVVGTTTWVFHRRTKSWAF